MQMVSGLRLNTEKPNNSATKKHIRKVPGCKHNLWRNLGKYLRGCYDDVWGGHLSG